MPFDAGGVNHSFFDFLGDVFELFGIAQKQFAPLGQGHAIGGALKQGALEAVFEILDPGGDGGLGEVQGLSGPTHAAKADNGKKGAELFEIETCHECLLVACGDQSGGLGAGQGEIGGVSV